MKTGKFKIEKRKEKWKVFNGKWKIEIGKWKMTGKKWNGKMNRDLTWKME
jgi:hypothetical protein